MGELITCLIAVMTAMNALAHAEQTLRYMYASCFNRWHTGCSFKDDLIYAVTHDCAIAFWQITEPSVHWPPNG